MEDNDICRCLHPKSEHRDLIGDTSCRATAEHSHCSRFVPLVASYPEKKDSYFLLPVKHQPQFSNGSLITLCVVEELDECAVPSQPAMATIFGLSVCRRHLGLIRSAVQSGYDEASITEAIFEGTYDLGELHEG